MSRISSASALFPEAVNPLNFRDDDEYVESFHRPAPTNLGILIDVIRPDGDMDAEFRVVFMKDVVIGAVNQLVMSDGFRQKYLPAEVEEFEIRICGTVAPKHYWHPFPMVWASWAVDGNVIMASFYDADQEITDSQLEGIGTGIIAVQECIAASGTVQPSAEDLLYLHPDEARDHRDAVGSVYEDHVGVWCKSLVPLWDVLMHKLHSYLKTIPAGGLLTLVDGAEDLSTAPADSNRPSISLQG